MEKKFYSFLELFMYERLVRFLIYFRKMVRVLNNHMVDFAINTLTIISVQLYIWIDRIN